MRSSFLTVTLSTCKKSWFYFVPFPSDYLHIGEFLGGSWYWDLFHLLLPSSEFFLNSHFMGIHQLPRAHPQRTIQSAVMILYLFPTCNSTVPFIYLFLVFRIIYLLCSTECLIKGWVFTKWKYSFLVYLLILYERIILFSFSPKSHAVGGVDVLGPKQQN